MNWIPEHGETFEYITSGLGGFLIASRVCDKDDPFDFSATFASNGNCFKPGFLNESHTYELNALIRSFGNAKAGG